MVVCLIETYAVYQRKLDLIQRFSIVLGRIAEVIPVIGRPTKGAAYALLAKVYMQGHKWQEAVQCLEWLVDGEGKNYYDLTTD